eukprot:3312984-Pleurochrysis_carterae.AAC.1
MPLAGGTNLNGTASGSPTDLQVERPYRASPTGLMLMLVLMLMLLLLLLLTLLAAMQPPTS